MYKYFLKEFKDKKICNWFIFFLHLFFVSLPILVAGLIFSNIILSIIGGFCLALSHIYCHIILSYSDFTKDKKGD